MGGGLLPTPKSEAALLLLDRVKVIYLMPSFLYARTWQTVRVIFFSSIPPTSNTMSSTCAYYWSAGVHSRRKSVSFWMNAMKHESLSGAFTKPAGSFCSFEGGERCALTWLDNQKYSFNHAYRQKYASRSNCMLATEEIARDVLCGTRNRWPYNWNTWLPMSSFLYASEGKYRFGIVTI
jgi:hypothetical protein